VLNLIFFHTFLKLNT